MRLPLLLAALLAAPVLAAPAQATPLPAPASPAASFTVLQANIGNINITPGACGDQAVKLCLKPVEDRITERLRALDPDVVLLQEVLPSLVCAPPAEEGDFGTPPTSPSRLNPQHLCNPAVAAALPAVEQLDRLLPPEQYATRCNDPLIDPADPGRVIPPWDCVGVKRSAGRLTGFVSLPGTAPGAVAGETCDNGFTVSIARLEVAGRPLQVTTAHPDSGGQRAGCRAEKLSRMFAELGGERPSLPTVVAGDMNLDPYRGSDVSTALWNDMVGPPGEPRPYVARSGIGEADPPPFSSNICGVSQLDPTGLVVDDPQPPTAPCASTIDHVATTADLGGTCDTLGEAPGDSGRLDGGGGTDHRGIACTLAFAAPALLPVPSPAPVPAPAAAAPRRDSRALAATGAVPAVAASGALALLLAGAAVRRRRTASALGAGE